MLGHKVVERLAPRFETVGASRARDAAVRQLEAFSGARIIPNLDAEAPATIDQTLDVVRPDVVVNCIGIIKQVGAAKDAIRSIKVNALFPHELSVRCARAGARMIHLSTDCVFSGDSGMYSEADRPDALDLYGRSKLLGEVAGPNVVTLRTSMIGRELRGFHSLLEWYLRQPEGHSIRGFTAAIFSGLTTIALADEIARIIAEHPELNGLYHVSADAISKYDLLRLVRDVFGRTGEIVPDDDLHCDRSLVSDRYRAAVGFTPKPWQEMIRELRADTTPYDRLRQLAVAS
jgi:dTDP-4-dehydrorhamnose reductase